MAAARFREVVDRWNAESVKLHAALQRISATITYNERTLREAAESHSHGIAATVQSRRDAQPQGGSCHDQVGRQGLEP